MNINYSILDDVPLLRKLIIAVVLIFIFQFGLPQVTSAFIFPNQPEVKETIKSHSNIAPAPYRSIEQYHEALAYNTALKEQYKIKYTTRIPVTAYSSTVDQCDSTPFITASGTHVRDGIIATNYLPIGTKVRFPEVYGDKVFVVEDIMNARFYFKADILMEYRSDARAWGLKHLKMEVLEG